VLCAGGALLSIHPDGTQRRQWQFLQRNSVLAALSDAMVVVQAPLKSGALSAAAHARRLGRPVFVVPHAPWDALGAGSAVELTRGAIAVTSGRQLARALASAHDAQARLPLARHKPASSHAETAAEEEEEEEEEEAAAPFHLGEHATSEQRTLWDAIEDRPQHLDAIAARCQLPRASLASAILTLTFEGAVVEQPAGHFRRTSDHPSKLNNP
jgi:DNA processing protein